MGTIISRFAEKSTEKSSDETTCISITAETYKCIDISAFVPQCITITSNVPTSELYQEQYNRDDVEITDAPILEIILINNEAPVLNVNLDEEGMVYVTDFDTVYIKITNYDTNVEYVNLFSNEDGNDAVVYLDEAEERIVWALDDYAFDGTQMWFYAQAKESDKLISPQSNVTVMQMEQTIQPSLSSWVSHYENTVLNITIQNYDATYTYSEPIVTGGTAVRTDNIIAWTLPDVTADTHHEISITATAPLMYESLLDASGGVVLVASCIPIFTTDVSYSIYCGVAGYVQITMKGTNVWYGVSEGHSYQYWLDRRWYNNVNTIVSQNYISVPFGSNIATIGRVYFNICNGDSTDGSVVSYLTIPIGTTAVDVYFNTDGSVTTIIT